MAVAVEFFSESLSSLKLILAASGGSAVDKSSNGRNFYLGRGGGRAPVSNFG